jgi:dihydropteroate synthase
VKIIPIRKPQEALEWFRKIGVDACGVDAMLPKTVHLNILLEAQPCKIANIIKQEMLALGGDAAIARGSVSCSVAASDVLIMGTLKQINRLKEKLKNQPFGLGVLAEELSKILQNLYSEKFVLKTSQREIVLGERTLIMGILNATPDSFSDGGLFNDERRAVDHALKMREEGADIIDIGGESTRPGSRSVPTKVELKRVLPVIEHLKTKVKVDVPISIDTKKAEVARRAVEAGAEIVNDVSAMNADRNMAAVVFETNAAVILMHMKGKPCNMQKGDLRYHDLMGDIARDLQQSVNKALQAGIGENRIVIDPGIGFGKTPEDNLRIIKNLAQLKVLGMPLLIGTSRKSFIGRITGEEPRERLEGTTATVAAAIMNGCHIVRVHDVATMKKVAAVTDAIVRT